MLATLLFINILLLCFCAFVLIAYHAWAANAGVQLITAIVSASIVTGFLYFFAVVFGWGMPVLAIVLSGLNAGFLILHRNECKQMLLSLKGRFRVSNREILLPLFIAALLTAYFFVYIKRWGKWDAMAIWNMHAGFLYEAEHWKAMFNPDLSWTHPDYPLYLPALTAFFWRSLGNMDPYVPAIICWVQLITIPLLCYAALYNAKIKWPAIFAMGIFLLNPSFIIIVLTQYADAFVGLFILLSFVLYTTVRDKQYLLGFIAASAMWVKNEGILFFIVFTLIFLFQQYKNRIAVKQFLIGALLPVAVLIFFKCISPVNDLVAGNNDTGTLLHKLVDYHRYIAIASSFAYTLFFNYPEVLILLAIMLVISPRFFISTPFVAICMMLAGYFVVYLATPLPLEKHLASSAIRLLHHVYPLFIFSVGLCLQKMYLGAPSKSPPVGETF